MRQRRTLPDLGHRRNDGAAQLSGHVHARNPNTGSRRLRHTIGMGCLSNVLLVVLYRICWHASPSDFVFDPSADPDGSVAARLLRPRPALVLGARLLDPGPYASEAMEFIDALEPYFYLAVENVGDVDRAEKLARAPEQQRRLEELMGDARIKYVTSRPHYRLVLGTPDEIACPTVDSSTQQLQLLCVGRTVVEGDRLPSNLAEQLRQPELSELWLRSSAQVEIFHRAGVLRAARITT